MTGLRLTRRGERVRDLVGLLALTGGLWAPLAVGLLW